MGPFRLITFGYKRHVDFSRSPAFKKALIDPLKAYQVEIDIVEHGTLDWCKVARKQPLVFFDRQPPVEVLRIPDVRIVWIPMWEAHSRKPQRWWNGWARYPIRFISFSRHLTQIARKAGIPVLDVQYFDDPHELAPVSWKNELNVFYWNRAGLLNKRQIISLCHALQIDHFYYRPTLDHYVPKSTQFSLPERVGNTQVHTVPHFESQKEYLAVLAKANLYIAPRWFEGIGLTFLEAMASGCVVLANNAPTMNEYIVNGETGIFLPYNWHLRYLIRFKSKLEQKLGLDYPAPSPLIRYDWTRLLNHDLSQIGANARKASEEGRKRYLDSVGSMIDFIFDW